MRPLADPALPGLATALDGASVAAWLSERLPECREGWQVVEARPIDVQYSPGERCIVLHQVKFRVPGVHHSSRQLVAVRALREGEAPPPVPEAVLRRYVARAASSTRPSGMLRTPWMHVASASLVAHAYPVDPALPSLSDAVDPQRMKELLTPAWAARGLRVRSVTVDPLAYTPESRAALIYEVLSEDVRTKVPELRRLVAKLHGRRSPGRLFSGAWALWRRANGRVNIGPPVGWVAVANVSLQEHLRGTRLSDLAGTGSFVRPVRKAAHAIAHVHSLKLPLLSERTVAKEAAVCRRWAGVMTGIKPDGAPRIERLLGRLLSEMEARFASKGAVHADFHLANVLVEKGAVSIIDWDQLAHGDPMVDVGRFLASLRVSALRTHDEPNALADAGAAFLETYLRATGDDERRARLFEAEALLIAAGGPFRLQREGWERSAALLLDEAERVLEQACRGPAVAVARGSADAGDGAAEREPGWLPFAERMTWARDRTFMLSLLVPVLRDAWGAGLEPVRCERKVEWWHSESARVRYALAGVLDSAPWEAIVVGNASAATPTSGGVRRVEALRLALPPGALRLPRVLGLVAPLGMVVVEPQDGKALLDLVGTPEGPAAAERAGRALAALQSSRVALDKERLLARDLRSLKARVEEGAAEGDPLAGAVASAASLVTLRLESERFTTPPLAPSLSGVRLRDVVLVDGAVALQAARDAFLGPPLVLAGTLLAELAMLDDDGAAAGAFRSGYCSALSLDAAELAPFEALGLLRLACRTRHATAGESLARREDMVARVRALATP